MLQLMTRQGPKTPGISNLVCATQEPPYVQIEKREKKGGIVARKETP